jgi:hypothetical protein
MTNKNLVRFIALLAVVALALPVMAKPISKNISIVQPAKLGTSQLTAGEYQLLIDGTRVTVQKGKNVVAEVTGRWEERDAKSRYSSVLLGADGQVQEVRFAGENRVLVLSTP